MRNIMCDPRKAWGINREVVGGYHHYFFSKWKFFVKSTATTNSAPKPAPKTKKFGW
jgi:hypothetical protein